MKKVIKDFSGGMTDFIQSAPENMCREADNFFITKDKGLQIRPGIERYNTTEPQPVGNGNPLNEIIQFNNEIYTHSDNKIYRVDDTPVNITGGTKLTAITKNDGFDELISGSKVLGDNLIISGIAYSSSEGTWVAVGSQNQGFYSKNGTEWIFVDIKFGATYDVWAVCWDSTNSLFIAVGEAGKVSTSPDGITWTARTIPAWSGSNIYAVFTDDGGVSCAVGANGYTATSPDGTTWTDRGAVSGGESLYGIHHDQDDLWITVGGDGISYYCADPTTVGNWTSVDVDASYTGTLRSVAYNGSNLWAVIGGDEDYIWTTTDGTSYTRYDITGVGSSVGTFFSILHDQSGRWIAVGDDGDIVTSTDGTTWSAQSLDINNAGSFRAVGYNGSKWLALGNLYNTGVYYPAAFNATSTDGTNWTLGNQDWDAWSGFGSGGWSRAMSAAGSVVADQDGTGGSLTLDISVVAGTRYKISFDVITSTAQATITVSPDTTYPADYTIITAGKVPWVSGPVLQVGAGSTNYGVVFDAGTTTTYTLQLTASAHALSIDNFIVEEVEADTIDILDSTSTPYIDYIKWGGKLFITNTDQTAPIKIWQEDSSDTDTLKAVTAGLPKLASLSANASGSGYNYIYGACYYYQYDVDGNIHRDYGPVKLFEDSDSSAIDNTNPIIVTVPELTNSSGELYDIANIRIVIWRTKNNGETLYYVGDVPNGTTTFVDTVADSALGNVIHGETAYITGGIVDNDPPPKSKYITITDDTAWYANTYYELDSNTLPTNKDEYTRNRVRQSIANDLDSCPESFYVDVDNDITGIGKIGQYPIVFTEDKVYRIEGRFDEEGNGYLRAIIISDKDGCISNRSIVESLDRIYFGGRYGWYVTDGFKVKLISSQIPNSYKDIVDTSNNRIWMTGTYDQKNERVYWAVAESDTLRYLYVFDETYGGFTKWSYGTYYDPSSILNIDINGQSVLLMGTIDGYLFKHDDSNLADESINAYNDEWIVRAIEFNFIHIDYDFGNALVRKWNPRVNIYFDPLDQEQTVFSLNIYDNGQTGSNSLDHVNFIKYGNTAYHNKRYTLLDYPDDERFEDKIAVETRRFPHETLRVRTRALNITYNNTCRLLSNSSVDGTGSVNSVDKVTITGTSAVIDSGSWPTNIEFYGFNLIDSNGDETVFYSGVYERTNNTTLVLSEDQGNYDSQDWVIYPKFSSYNVGVRGVVFKLKAISYDFVYMSETDEESSYNDNLPGANTTGS